MERKTKISEQNISEPLWDNFKWLNNTSPQKRGDRKKEKKYLKK